MRLVDPRASRFEQGVIVVVLLAGFVFSQPWSIPIAFAVAAAGVALGDRSPVVATWKALIAPRLRSTSTLEPEPVTRAQTLLLGAGLALATGILWAGSVGLASIVAALVAVIAALGATNVVTLAAELHRDR